MPGSILEISFKKLEKQMSSAIVAEEKQIIAARTRALRKLGKRARTIIKKELSASLSVPQKYLNDRFYISGVDPGEVSITLWIGTYNIEPHTVSKPRQQKRGVKAGKMFYKGAFFAGIYTPVKKVWIRKSSSFYDPVLYPSKSSSPTKSGRFPVVKAKISVEEKAKQILEEKKVGIGMEFIKIFEQELNYEVNVRGK